MAEPAPGALERRHGGKSDRLGRQERLSGAPKKVALSLDYALQNGFPSLELFPLEVFFQGKVFYPGCPSHLSHGTGTPTTAPVRVSGREHRGMRG